MTDTLNDSALNAACNAYDKYTGDILPDAYLKSHVEHHRAAMKIAIEEYLRGSCSEIPVIDESCDGNIYGHLLDIFNEHWDDEALRTHDAIKQVFDVFRPYLKREIVEFDRKEVATLAFYVLGWTPDKNTQTPEEVEATLESVDRIAHKYCGITTVGNKTEIEGQS